MRVLKVAAFVPLAREVLIISVAHCKPLGLIVVIARTRNEDEAISNYCMEIASLRSQ